MPLTGHEVIERYGAEAFTAFWLQPSEEIYAETEATHTVLVPIAVAVQGEGAARYEVTDNGEIYLVGECGKLYSDLPYRGTAEDPIRLTSLIHNTLLIVEDERAGPNGDWHFVKVISSDPEINNKVGYIAASSTLHLPDIPSSLPMVFDTCIETVTKDFNLCDFTAPVWYETTQPYFNEKTCEYSVAILTRFNDTGNAELRDRMDAQVERGARELLEYYNKIRDDEAINRYLSAFMFAKASAWYLPPGSRSSRLKVLVTIPAKYFDAIGEDLGPQIYSPTSKVIGLLSSDLAGQIKRVAEEMRLYETWGSWQEVRASWLGPEPDFGEFSFGVEADNLEEFFFRLSWFFENNGLSIRPGRPDAIEIGVTEDYKITYILVNTPDLGEKELRVSLDSLRQMTPFNAPRTLALVEKLRPLSEEIKTNGSLKGGWQEFLKKYISPSPKYNPAAKDKKCKATITNPWKCVPEKWHKILQYERDNPTCGTGPSGKMQLFGAGDTLEGLIKSGVAAAPAFGDKLAALKMPKLYEIEKKDGKDFAKYLTDAAQVPSWYFVEDPSYGKMAKDIRRAMLGKAAARPASGPLGELAKMEEFGGEDSGLATNPGFVMLSDVVTEIASKIDPAQMIRKYIDCKCGEWEDRAKELDLRGRREAAAGYRLQASAMGCGNICGAIPILCSCLPFDFPPKFTYPDIFPLKTVDIMAFLAAILLNTIINIIVQFLVEFIKRLLDDLLKCGRDEPPGPFMDVFTETFNPDDISDENMSGELGANITGIQPELAGLIQDTAVLTTPLEFCSLLTGDANADTLQLVEVLIRESYPLIHSLFSNVERIRRLYVAVGNLINPEICDNLGDLLEQVDIEPQNSICADTDLREDMLEGRATEEQIREQLDEALRCDQARAQNMIDIAQGMAAGEDVLGRLIPNIFQTPSNPDGILPRSPPSVRYVEDIATKHTFESIERVYYGEMDGNIPTLITTKNEMETRISDEPDPMAELAESLGMPLPASAMLTPGNRVSTLAAGLLDYLIGDLGPLSDGTVSQGDNSNSIIIELPPRRIQRESSDIFRGTIEQVLGAVSGFGGTPETGRWISDRVRIVYTLCDPPLAGLLPSEQGEDDIDSTRLARWNEIKDAFSVEVQRWSPGAGDWVPLFNFNSRRPLPPEILATIQSDFGGTANLSGLHTPTGEAFANFLSEKWTYKQNVRGTDGYRTTNELGNRDEASTQTADWVDRLRNPTSDLYGLHVTAAKYINEAFIRKIGQRMAIAFRLKFGTTFADQLDTLAEIAFRPDPTCGPDERTPGLLNIPYAALKQREEYDNSELENPERFIRSMRYAFSTIYIRIFIVEALLNGFVPFSYLRVQDLLSSDLIIRYFLNQFKNQITKRAETSSGPDFYREIASTIQEFLMEKLLAREQILDPITNEPVNIIFGDVEEISFSPVETNFSCVDPTIEDPADDCVDVSATERVGEMADGAPFPGQPGVKSMGYMEYVIREQFKIVGDQMESMFDTTVQDLTFELFQNYIATTDAPVFGPDFVAAARFSTGETEPVVVNEEAALFPAATTYVYMTERIRAYFSENVTREELETDEEFLNGWRNFMLGSEAADEDAYIIEGVATIPDLDVRINERYNRADDDSGTGEDIGREQVGQAVANWVRLPVDIPTSLKMVLDMYEGRAAYMYRKTSNYQGSVVTLNATLYVASSNIIIEQASTGGIPASVSWDGSAWNGRDAHRNARVNRPRILTSIDESNSLLEHVHDAAFRWILAETTAGIRGNLGTAISTDFEYLQNGGFYTEKFIRIEEHEDWRRVLAGVPQGSESTAILMIRDRSPLLMGVVNIAMWEEYLRSLMEYKGKDQLDLFTTSGDKTFFDITKYFKSWSFGERLMFMYPLEGRHTRFDDSTITYDSIPEMQSFREYTSGILTDDERPHSDVAKLMLREKAFLLKESPADPSAVIGETAQRTGMTVAEVGELLGGEIFGTEDIFNTWTVPLIEKTTKIEANTLHDVVGTTNLAATFDDVERIVNSLFSPGMKAELETLVGEFNNLILPSSDLPRVSSHEMWELYRDLALPDQGGILLSWEELNLPGPPDAGGNAPGFEVQGDIKSGVWGLDSNYAYGGAVFPSKMKGATLPEQLSANTPELWIDSRGWAVGAKAVGAIAVHPSLEYAAQGVWASISTTAISQNNSNAGAGEDLAAVKQTINERSKKLFGWGILDSYGYWDYRAELMTSRKNGSTSHQSAEALLISGIDFNVGAVPSGEIFEDPPAWSVQIDSPTSHGQEETQYFYPIFNPHGARPACVDSGEGRCLVDDVWLSLNGSSDWLDSWYVFINSESSDEEVVPVGVETFQQNPASNLTIWDRFLNVEWDRGPSASDIADRTGGVGDTNRHTRAFWSMKEYVLEQNWGDAVNRRGGLFLIYVEVSKLKAKIRDFKRRFGSFSSFARLSDAEQEEVAALFETISTHLENQMAGETSVGESAISKCFLDGDPENTAPLNTPFSGLCSEYNFLRQKKQQIEFYSETIYDANARPPIRDLGGPDGFYESAYRAPLRDEISADPQFEVLFKYIFPMPRVHSLLSIYSIEHVGHLPGRQMIFDNSKQLVEELYWTIKYAGTDQYWNREQKKCGKWWCDPLELPAWLIIALSPAKILMLLFTLIPGLQWLFNMMNWQPKLPPYRPKRRVCR